MLCLQGCRGSGTEATFPPKLQQVPDHSPKPHAQHYGRTFQCRRALLPFLRRWGWINGLRMLAIIEPWPILSSASVWWASLTRLPISSTALLNTGFRAEPLWQSILFSSELKEKTNHIILRSGNFFLHVVDTHFTAQLFFMLCCLLVFRVFFQLENTNSMAQLRGEELPVCINTLIIKWTWWWLQFNVCRKKQRPFSNFF